LIFSRIGDCPDNLKRYISHIAALSYSARFHIHSQGIIEVLIEVRRYFFGGDKLVTGKDSSDFDVFGIFSYGRFDTDFVAVINNKGILDIWPFL
jgi:hypothetical protein